MVVYHRRNQDEEAALGSQRVRSRTTKLIRNLNISNLQVKIQELNQSTTIGQGDYSSRQSS